MRAAKTNEIGFGKLVARAIGPVSLARRAIAGRGFSGFGVRS